MHFSNGCGKIKAIQDIACMSRSKGEMTRATTLFSFLVTLSSGLLTDPTGSSLLYRLHVRIALLSGMRWTLTGGITRMCWPDTV